MAKRLSEFTACGLLEKLVCKLLPDTTVPEANAELDERLLATPSIALERCQVLTNEMADVAARAFHNGAASLLEFSPELSRNVREDESRTDHYEDILGTYLVKLSSLQISEADSSEAAMLLKALNDFDDNLSGKNGVFLSKPRIMTTKEFWSNDLS